MRHTLMHLAVTENLPACPACGATTEFAHAADLSRDGRLYLIFRCPACSAGETKVWRSEWQPLADTIRSDED